MGIDGLGGRTDGRIDGRTDGRTRNHEAGLMRSAKKNRPMWELRGLKGTIKLTRQRKGKIGWMSPS